VAGNPLRSGQATAIGQAPRALATASDGTLYIASPEQDAVRALDPTTHEETVVAGDGGIPGNGDHVLLEGEPVPALSTPLIPESIAVDSGNLIVGEGDNSQPGAVGLVASANCASDCPFGLASTTKGDIYAIAGGTNFGSFPEDGEAGNSAEVNPSVMTTDSSGDLLIGGVAYKNLNEYGVVDLLAANNCSSSCPFGLASMTKGDIYVIAGGGEEIPADDKAATGVNFAAPSGISVDSAGDLFISVEFGGVSHDVSYAYMVGGANCASSCPFGLASTTKGDVYVVAGGGSNIPANGEPATSAKIDADGLTLDASNDVIISEQLNDRVWLLARTNCTSSCSFGLSSLTAGDIYRLAGGGSTIGDGGPATSAEVAPAAVTTDGSGSILVADPRWNRVRLIAASHCASGCPYGFSSLTESDIYTVAGNGKRYSGDEGPATDAQLGEPTQIATEDVANGNTFVASGDGRIALIAGASCSSCGFGLGELHHGDIYTVEGGGEGYIEQGNRATEVGGGGQGVALDSHGDVLTSDGLRVILVAKHNCSSECPFGLTSMTEGDLYIVAGTFNFNPSGEEGPATEAGLGGPRALMIDPEGNLLIVAEGTDYIRMVAANTCASNCAYGLAKTVKGDIYKIAGGGSSTTSGSLAMEVNLGDIFSLAMDGSDIVTTGNGGKIWLIANTSCSDSCPFGLANIEKTHAYVLGEDFEPFAVAVDRAGNVLTSQGIVASVDLEAKSACSASCAFGLSSTTVGGIYRIVGNGTSGFSGDGGPATKAQLSEYVMGLAVNNAGNLLIADTENDRVREVTNGTASEEKANKEEDKSERNEQRRKQERRTQIRTTEKCHDGAGDAGAGGGAAPDGQSSVWDGDGATKRHEPLCCAVDDTLDH
jgi:hypothetical protein